MVRRAVGLRLFCRHRWQARATTQYAWQTDVLMMCERCGSATTKRLKGKWSLADFAVFSEKDAERLLEKH